MKPDLTQGHFPAGEARARTGPVAVSHSKPGREASVVHLANPGIGLDLGITISPCVLSAAGAIYKDDLRPLEGRALLYDPALKSF